MDILTKYIIINDILLGILWTVVISSIPSFRPSMQLATTLLRPAVRRLIADLLATYVFVIRSFPLLPFLLPWSICKAAVAVVFFGRPCSPWNETVFGHFRHFSKCGGIPPPTTSHNLLDFVVRLSTAACSIYSQLIVILTAIRASATWGNTRWLLAEHT